jgi:Zn-dependent oligopeptidase
MSAHQRMAGNPSAVCHLLVSLSAAILPFAARELRMLAAQSLAHDGCCPVTPTTPSLPLAGSISAFPMQSAAASIYASCSPRPSDGRVLSSWDIEFLEGQCRIAGMSAELEQNSRRYFTLRNALYGISLVLRRVFGVDMSIQPGSEDEVWDAPERAPRFLSRMGQQRPRPSHVLRCDLTHDSEGDLGTLYLDLAARDGKPGGAAHYVIQCGKRSHPREAAFERALGSAPTRASTDGMFQLPIVVLAASLMHGQGTPLDATLSFSEVETLWHEFGHAIHSLLSRTEFQHLHGTRGALDFVEIPSHVFEYWCRDYRVVSQWALASDGRPITKADFGKLLRQHRHSFAALRMQRQLVHTAFDLACFGAQINDLLGSSASDILARSAERASVFAASDSTNQSMMLPDILKMADSCTLPLQLWDESNHKNPIQTAAAPGGQPSADVLLSSSSVLFADVQAAFSFVPAVRDTCWEAGFVHLLTYGAGYYSYLYAQIVAASVWQRLFAIDPLSRQAGNVHMTMIPFYFSFYAATPFLLQVSSIRVSFCHQGHLLTRQLQFRLLWDQAQARVPWCESSF